MKTTATFSNNETVTYKGDRKVGAAWALFDVKTGELCGRGWSLDARRAEASAKNRARGIRFGDDDTGIFDLHRNFKDYTVYYGFLSREENAEHQRKELRGLIDLAKKYGYRIPEKFFNEERFYNRRHVAADAYKWLRQQNLETNAKRIAQFNIEIVATTEA